MENTHQAKIERVREVSVSFDGSDDDFIPRITPSNIKDPPQSASPIAVDSSGSMTVAGMSVKLNAWQQDALAEARSNVSDGIRIAEMDLKDLEKHAELFALKTFTKDSTLTLEKLEQYKHQTPIPIYDECLGQGTMLYRKENLHHLWGYLVEFVCESIYMNCWNRYVDVLNYRMDDAIVEVVDRMEVNHDAAHDFFYYNDEKILDILSSQFDLKDVLYDIGFKFVRESELGMIVQNL